MERKEKIVTEAAVKKELDKTGTRILYKSCPLCDSGRIKEFITADCTKHPIYNKILPPQMVWKRCGACTHVFTDGYYTDEASQVLFSKTNDHQKVGYDIEGQRFVSARMIEKVLNYVQKGDWMDIGFGNGSLLFTAHEYGFTPVGTDLRRDNVEDLKKWGIEAYCKDIAELGHEDRYSVISMADVLEHVPYPKDFLASVHALLADEGLLFISMPNMDSMLWNAMDKAGVNPYWGELEHFHNFGRTRLYSLLEECGFTPLRYGVSERYRACMEVIARKKPGQGG